MENQETPIEEESVQESASVPAEAPVVNTEAESVPCSVYDAPPPRSHWKKIVAAVLALCILGGSCSIAYRVGTQQSSVRANRNIESLTHQVNALQKRLDTAASREEVIPGVNLAAGVGALSPREIFANNEKSVVGISCTIQSTSYGGQVTKGTSTGSGFILTDNGYVVTNHHVVEGAVSVSVIMSTEEEYEATVVGSDAMNDIAVLKIEAENLPAVTLGSSDSLNVGDFVVAIGNPLGALTATMTYGIVSGKDRQCTKIAATSGLLCPLLYL